MFSLSGTVDVSEIYSVLGEDTAVYTLTIPNPNKYFVENPAVLDVFALESRKLLDLVRQEYGEQETLHIFPAMPVSLAVRFGMDYMPNIDKQMLIYNKIINKGFIPTITIGGTDG